MKQPRNLKLWSSFALLSVGELRPKIITCFVHKEDMQDKINEIILNRNVFLHNQEVENKNLDNF